MAIIASAASNIMVNDIVIEICHLELVGVVGKCMATVYTCSNTTDL